MSNDRGIDFVEVVAKKKLNAPDDWSICGWERIGDSNDLIVEGGVTRLLKSGKNKGRRTWLDSVISKCCVTDGEVVNAKREYEAETGNCAICCGTGQACSGWNCDSGHSYITCKRCDGTGKAPKGGE